MINIEIAGSFHDIILSSTRFSLSSSQRSSIQRSPPTRSGANRVQCIQGGCTTSPYSSLWRVSVLSCSCCVFILFLLAWSLHSFPLIWWKVMYLSNHSESAERCMPASPSSTIHSLTSSACYPNPRACVEPFAYCTNSWEIWLCTLVSLHMAVLMV